MFCTSHIAVAHEGDLLAVEGDDAVEDILAGRNLCQHGITFVNMGDSCKNNTVATVLKERAHAVAPHMQGSGMSFSEELAHFGKEEVVREFECHVRLDICLGLWLVVRFCYGVVAQFGRFFIGQTAKRVGGHMFDEQRQCITDAVVHPVVPFHR